jgi:hypothetical protein
VNKIKIWHDNTGLDPAWFLSRVIIRDLQTKDRYYFLVDDWLQISAFDYQSSVEKEVYSASEEEIGLFSEVFQVQRAYLKADSHLWFSIVTRPTRSRYTRLMRLTVASASFYVFTLLTMIWYKKPTYEMVGDAPQYNIYAFWFSGSDIVTGTDRQII